MRVYGPAQTPYARVLAVAEVKADEKAKLRILHQELNPFGLARQIEREKRTIHAQRLLAA